MDSDSKIQTSSDSENQTDDVEEVQTNYQDEVQTESSEEESDDDDSQSVENDLFISSTISQDGTKSKASKERAMLVQLTDKLSSGELALSSTALIQPTSLGPLRNSMPPYPGMPAHILPEAIRPPPGPSSSGWTPLLHRSSGPPAGEQQPRLKADNNARWRRSMVEKETPTAPTTHHNANLGKSKASYQSQGLAGSAEVQVDHKTPSNQNPEPQSDTYRSTEKGKPNFTALQASGFDTEIKSNKHAGHRDDDKFGNAQRPNDTGRDPSPLNLGLAESLSYITQKHLGMNMLDQSAEVTRFGGYLLDTIEMLENQVSYLRAQDVDDDKEDGVEGSSQAQVPHSQVVHRLYCSVPWHDHDNTLYEDEPKMSNDRLASKTLLTGRIPIPNLSRYLAQRPSICIVIYKEHNCAYNDKMRPLGRRSPTPRLERLGIVSPNLQKALDKVAKFPPYVEASINQDIGDDQVKEMVAPYDFLFHHRKQLAALEKESETYSAVLTPLRRFLDQNYESEYREAEALFQRGRVSSLHVGKLFKPNQMVVSIPRDSRALAAYVLDEPLFKIKDKLVLQGWSWQYNGTDLRRKFWEGTMSFVSDDETVITELPIHPVEFARPSVLKTLETRGEKFWSMKDRQFSTYTGYDSNHDHHYVEARFMIDISTYQKMHRVSTLGIDELSKFDTWPAVIRKQETLSDKSKMLLPPTTFGFNFHQKRWVSLNVEKIEPMKWNKKAFDRLVLDPKTKELIYALVDVQASKDQSMDDIITGKGNGLIILLHGSPGTGKTLTAESVAEIAEKPLYRVTCGDIGTQAQEVEKYLQSVLYLGKIWDCVLLMDEADVFLEERTMSDLQRNSLVSVFLRILEYYEGILILTSNRVGTFDEAFKSRIQVAIHYDNLTKRSRKQIWQNFFDMLEEANEEANMPELERRLDELATEEMNGRQIRNALLTARQLAKHRKERLDWQHLSQVIKTSADFNKYLKAVRGHSDEQWAREEMLR